ncbi:hypothetical protein MKW98_019850 [Papaver atlanticum]|uniref:Uncharacterized protein n=1 Tax=Papaver atlanticum TaxID=357466 RepID=A0AAD4X5U4_9MAGN|nr:hypothetical protein MKW98_019850 [Papaver atlanticum]
MLLSDTINCFCLRVSRFLAHWLLSMPLKGTHSFPTIPFAKLANLAFLPWYYDCSSNSVYGP